jgi:DNA-binding cell septation regulator SpoVG
MKRDDISKIYVTTGDWGKLRGFATIYFTNGLVVRGFRVIQGQKALFVGFPSTPDTSEEPSSSKRKYKDIVHCVDKDENQALKDIILEAYALELTSSSSESFSKHKSQNGKKDPSLKTNKPSPEDYSELDSDYID